LRATKAGAWIVTMVTVAALGAGGCGGDDDEEKPAQGTTDQAGQETTEAERGAEAGTEQGTTGAKRKPRLARQWAGKVHGTDSYISVFTLTDGQTGAYLADGKQIAVLALGSLEGGRLSLRAKDGTTVTGTANGSVSGSVLLEDEQYRFSGERTSGEAGWYRARKQVGGKPVAAGYILLADGSQRGAVRRGDEVLAVPKFDPQSPTIEVAGVGSLTLLPVKEFVVREGSIS
jgi:hypothetical protein